MVAIVNGDNMYQYEQVQEIIVDVLKNRKLSFTREMIVKVIKNRLIEVDIDSNITDDIYFNFLLDGILNNMVECGIIYNFEHNNLYEPLEYIIYNKHLDNCSKVLYLASDNGRNYTFTNVATSKNQKTANIDDFILTGGVKDGRMITSEISYDEIRKLYDECIKEGSSRKDALEHILNFYSIKHFSLVNDDFINTVIIRKKTKKKGFTRILKKDSTKEKH